MIAEKLSYFNKQKLDSTLLVKKMLDSTFKQTKKEKQEGAHKYINQPDVRYS